jgi:hypothetical protein
LDGESGKLLEVRVPQHTQYQIFPRISLMVADTNPRSMVLSAFIRAIRGKAFSVPSAASCKIHSSLVAAPPRQEICGQLNPSFRVSSSGFRVAKAPFAIIRADSRLTPPFPPD